MASTAPVTADRVDWKRTILACMADYLDAGGIVAASAGLAIWRQAFGFDATALGLLAAFGVNAGAYAAGALVGGYLGDRLGRKRIYQYDLLVYVLGAVLVVVAVQGWMLFAGLIVMGLAIGADVPTSWALIGEIAPDRQRGRLVGLTSVFWSAGPVVVLLLALALAGSGLLGIRIVFAHLAVMALVTWLLRRRMAESEMWTAARDQGLLSAARVRDLFRTHGRPMFSSSSSTRWVPSRSGRSGSSYLSSSARSARSRRRRASASTPSTTGSRAPASSSSSCRSSTGSAAGCSTVLRASSRPPPCCW